jgi:pimeloyl-ACP methyl ester carboxylesterase
MPIAADIYFHAYQEEEKLPVVLIHGAGGTHMFWPSEVRRLPGYRVYALDLPGHGKSAGRGQQSITAYTRSVLDWLAALNLHRAVFIGHSMGGAIVQTLALDHPEHVLGVGLVGSAAKLRVNPQILENSANPTTFHIAVEEVVKRSFSAQAPEGLVELAGKRMTEVRPSVLHGDFIASDAFDVTDRVTEIVQPAVVICGAEDKMTPSRNSQFLADSLQSAQLEIVPGAGHMVMIEKPQEIADTLREFLMNIRF